MPPWAWIVQPGQIADVRQRLPGREDGRVEALRLAPVRLALEDQVREHVAGDVVEQQRGEDLVRLEEGAQDAGDQRPHDAAGAAGDDHRRDHERRRAAAAAEVEAGGGAGDRAHVHLALGADVEELHPERRRRGEAGERERRRGDQRLVERPGLRGTRRRRAGGRSRAGCGPSRRARAPRRGSAKTTEPTGTATESQRGCLRRRSTVMRNLPSHRGLDAIRVAASEEGRLAAPLPARSSALRAADDALHEPVHPVEAVRAALEHLHLHALGDAQLARSGRRAGP